MKQKLNQKSNRKISKLFSNPILILMIILIITFIVVSLSKPATASFTVKTSCDKNYCLEGNNVYINVNVVNEGIQTLKLEKILLMNYNEENFGEIKGGQIASGGKMKFSFNFVPELKETTTFQFKPCFLMMINQSGNLTENMICYDFKNITIMPNPVKHCKTDFDCEENRYCKTNLCFNLSCEGCTHPLNHTCEKYECCDNSKCNYDEVCENHNCVFIGCNDNEAFGNHTCEEIKCEQFKEAKEHKCVYKERFLESTRITIYVIIILFVISFAFGRKKKFIKANIQNYIRKKRIKYYKKKEEEELGMAETHYKLLKYLKKKSEIEKHKNLIKHHENEADRYRKRWIGYSKNIIICPICGREVPKGYEFCPYCGAKLD